MKVYEKFPEITSLKAKVLDRKYKNNITSLTLDRSILIPKNDLMIDDSVSLLEKEILDIKETKGGQLVKVRGNIKNKEVDLLVDKDLRYKNLYSTTAYILFKIFLESFYGPYKTELIIKEDTFIKVLGFDKKLDKNLIEELMDHAISSGLPIDCPKSNVMGLGGIDKSYISFDNTYKLRSFKIKGLSKDKDNLLLKIGDSSY